MDLNNIFSDIKEKLDRLNQEREELIKISREMIRNCSIAIKSIHRKEFDVYEEKIKEVNSQHESLLESINKNPLTFARYLKTPEQEFVEAVCLNALINDRDLPTSIDIGVDDVNYLLGLADVIGELRRHVLDKLIQDDTEGLDKILDEMENIYTFLFSLDFPKAIIHDLRRKTDIARSIIEKTRGDISLSLQINRLNKNLEQK
ncbi:MAG: hypothetical protein ACTSRI_06870 [Promethearchaeota archaeon]